MFGKDRGSFFNWATTVFVVVFFCLVIVAIYKTGIATALRDQQKQANTVHYAEQVNELIESRCSSRNVPELTQCIREILISTNEHQRAEQDLVAQKEMAVWSLWSISISGAAFVVTALGVWFVALTLDEARKTTRAAILAAEEAANTNDITKRAFLSDQRPWVDVDVQITSDLVFTQDGIVSEIKIITSNLGKTPASSVFVVTTIDLAEPGEFKDLKTKMMKFWIDQHNLRLLDRVNWGTQIGDAIFPGSPRTRTQPITVKSDLLRLPNSEGKKIMPGLLVACTYGPKEDGGFYVTAKMFHINGPGDVRKVHPLTVPASGTISKDEITVSNVFSAAYVT